uniref:Putative triabin n=1 Tax=Panstrongylus lignarius TaxID=156445 RepID=A0A224XWN6_9HEMI
MKMLIAVIIFGILTNAFAQISLGNKECRHEAMKNFDLNKYFKIQHAFVTHSKNGKNPNFCREITTTKHSNGTVETIAEGYDEINGTTYYSKTSCSGTQKNPKSGEFSFTCNILEDAMQNTLGKYSEYTSVIDTDYNTYAILYRCTILSEGPVTLEDISVLKKDINGDNGKVKKSLKDKNMDLDTFLPRNDKYCDRVKNEGKKEGKKKRA